MLLRNLLRGHLFLDTVYMFNSNSRPIWHRFRNVDARKK